MPWYNQTAKTDFQGVNYIHPLRQWAVEALIEKAKERKDITAVIIFGSVVSQRCTDRSDVDAVIVGDSTIPFICPDGCRYDILFYDRIVKPSTLWSDIERDGVVVYEA